MTIQWLKRVPEVARATYILAMEWLQYVVGYTAVDIFPAISWLLASGVNASLLDAAPQTVTVATGPFLPAHVGKYILLYGSTNARNKGVFKIVGVLSPTQAVVQAGSYGASFTSELNINWRLIDQAALTVAGLQQVVLEAPVAISGSTPAWQVDFELPASPSQTINIFTQPFGVWNSILHIPGSVSLPVFGHTSDVTPKWYFGTDGSEIIGFTENNAGTAPFSVFYSGSALPFEGYGFDPSCVVQWGDTVMATFPNTGSMVASDGTTIITSQGITLSNIAVPVNMFTGLQPSGYDLRNVAMNLVFGHNVAPFAEIRGTMRNMNWVSGTIAYKRFVSNNRSLLSLGSGIAVTWNGDLVV